MQKSTRISPVLEGEKLAYELIKEVGKTEKQLPLIAETKIYKRRWLQLGLFFVYSAVNTMQWIQFTIVANIMSRYYGVSSSAVDWTSIIFYVTYVILIFPVSYVTDLVGLRWTCLIGALGTSIGAWIKVFSVSPDRFVPVFIGQTIVAASQSFVLNGPPRLAANWFGSEEVATATAIGCFGGLAGVSVLFLITPILVKDHERVEDISRELTVFFMAVAVVCTIVVLLLYFFFQDEPHLPPSEARALQKMNRTSGSQGLWSKFRRVLRNKNFLLLCNLYGMNLGYLNAMCTLLNPLFLAHFQHGEADAGRLGLILTSLGNFGSIIFGAILDKTKEFKLLSIIIYFFTLVGQVLFAVGLIMEIKWLVFLSIAVIGIFTISYGSIGFELSAEATYPEPEQLPSALFNMAQQVYGTILALIVGTLLRTYGDTAAHTCLTAIIALGFILTIFTKDERRRQNAKSNPPTMSLSPF